MGISVISSPANAGGVANLSSVTFPSDGATLDFAALLSGQLAGLAPPTVNTLTTTGVPQEPRDKSKQADADTDLINGILAAQYPGLANQAIVSDTPPTRANQAIVTDTPPTRANQTIATDTLPTRANQAIVTDTLPTRANQAIVTDTPPTLANQAIVSDTPPTQVNQAIVSDTPPTQVNQAIASDTLPTRANQAIVSDTPPALTNQAIVSDTPPTLANQLIMPNIPPTLENRQSANIGYNKNSIDKLKPETSLEVRGSALNPTTQPQSTLKPQTSFISDSMSSAQPTLLAASSPSQGEAAIFAGDTLTGNTAPATFATLMSSHAAQPTQHNATINTPTISTPLQDNRWAQDFGDRIVWAAKNDQQIAQINITPAQLGPVQITLNLNGDQASIAFASPHAEVRKAIEDAMPNLREMLSTAGISLGQSNVGAQLPQQQRDATPQFANGARSAGETAILPADSRSGSTSPSLPIQRGRGLVDLFA